MKPVRYLQGCRSTGPARQRIGLRPVSRQDVHPRMVPQPLGEGRGLFTLQDVHRPMTLQVHQDSCVGAAPPQGKFVHPHYPGSGRRDLLLSLASEQRIWAGGIAQEPTDPGCRFRVAGMDQFQEDLSQSLGPAGIGHQHVWKGLGEDATQALEIVTEEFAGVNHQLDRPGAPGQVRGSAPVSTMDSGALDTALGTGHGLSSGFQVDNDSVVQPGYQPQPPHLWARAQGLPSHHVLP